jgi:hypothetical protein
MDDRTLDTINGPKNPKKEEIVSWRTVIITFVWAILIPYTLIYFVVRGVDSGYWGGKSGHVSGNEFMVWFMGKFHLVIIGTFLSSIVFVLMLLAKCYEEFQNRVLK